MSLNGKALRILAASSALASLLAGCGGGTAASTSTGASVGSSPPSSPPVVQEITGIATPSSVAVVTATNAQ
jgi:hypothetical protein